MQIKSDMLTIKPIQRRLSTENRLDSPFSDVILAKNMPDAVEQNRKRNLIYKNDAKSDLEALLELLGQLKIANNGGNTVNIQNNIINQIKNSIQIHSKSIQNSTVQNSLKELLQENKISETTINMAIAGVEQSLKKKIINHEIVFGGDVAFYPLSTHEKNEFSVENKAVHRSENSRESHTQSNYVTQNSYAYPTNVQVVYESIGQNFYNHILHNSRIIEIIYDKKKALERKRESAVSHRYAVDNDFLYYEKTEHLHQNQENYDAEISVYHHQESYDTSVSLSPIQEGQDTKVYMYQPQENQNTYIYLRTNLHQNQESIDVFRVENRNLQEESYGGMTAVQIDSSVTKNNVRVTQTTSPNILNMDVPKLPLPQILGKTMVAENVYRSLLQYDFHIMETLPQNIRNVFRNVALFISQSKNSHFPGATFGKMEQMHFYNRVFHSQILNAHTTLENTFTEANSYGLEWDNSLTLIQKMQGESIYHQQEDVLHQENFRTEHSVNVSNTAVSNTANNQYLRTAPSYVSWSMLFQEFHKLQGEYNTLVTQNQWGGNVLPSGVKRIFTALQMSANNNVFANMMTTTQQNPAVSNYNENSSLQLVNVEQVENVNVENQNAVHQSTTNRQTAVYMTQQNRVEGDDIVLSYHQESIHRTAAPQIQVAGGYFSKHANTQVFQLIQNKGISTVLQNIFHNQSFGNVYRQYQKNMLPMGVGKVFSALQMSLVHNHFVDGTTQIYQRNGSGVLSHMQTENHQHDGNVVHMRSNYLSKTASTQIFPLAIQKNVEVVLQSLFHKESFGGVEQKNTMYLSENTHSNQHTMNQMHQTNVGQQVKDANTLLEYRVFNSIYQSPVVYHLQQGILSRIFGGKQRDITNFVSYDDSQNIYHFAAGAEVSEAFLPMVQKLETQETLFQKAKVFYSYLMKHTEETSHIAKEVFQEKKEQTREQNTILLQRHNTLVEVESKEIDHMTLLQHSHQEDVHSTMGTRHFQKDSLWNYAYQTDARHSETTHHEEIKEATQKELMVFKKEQKTISEEVSKTRITELVEEVLSERIVSEGFTLQQETIIQKIVGQVLAETKEEPMDSLQDVNASGYIEEIYEKVYEKIERALVSERRRFGQ